MMIFYDSFMPSIFAFYCSFHAKAPIFVLQIEQSVLLMFSSLIECYCEFLKCMKQMRQKKGREFCLRSEYFRCFIL